MDVFCSALRVLMRRKLSSSPGDGGHVLRRPLSSVDITCLGLSTTLGTGIFTILAFAARENAGPSVVLSFLIAAVASCLGGLCYSELASRFPIGGPSYVYVYATIGELPAFLVGWAMIFEYLLGVALAAKAFTQYINVLSKRAITSFTMGLLGPESSFFARVPGFEQNIDLPSGLFVLVVGLLMTRNLKLSCLVNNVLVFFCFLVIVGIVLVSMCDLDAENWTTGPGFFPNGVAGIFSGASICFFSFHGYDIIGSTASECTHRIRIVPVGISLAFLLGLVACFSSSVSITLLVPASLLDHTAPLLQAFEIRNLKGMQYFVIIGAVTGLTAATIASLTALSRLLFFLANDGLLASCLTAYRPLDGTTWSATLVAATLASVIAMLVQSSTLLMWAGLGSLLAYMSVALATIHLRYGLAEKLPFESTELCSSQSTCSDLQARASSTECEIPREITRSVSDCYLNGRAANFAECVQCDFFEATRRRKWNAKSGNTNYVTAATEAANATNKLLLAGGNGDNGQVRFSSYGAVASSNAGLASRAATMAVEFVNQTYVTSLSSPTLHFEKRLPTEATSRAVSGLLGAMVAAMLAMGLVTTQVPRFFQHGQFEWWLELVATLIFFLITVLIVLVVREPHHSGHSRNSIPCVPLLPICAMWMNVHLAVCLPYSAWLAFVIWGLVGIFVYMSYGVWQSKEGSGYGASDPSTGEHLGCEEDCYVLSDEPTFGGDDDHQEMIQELTLDSDDGSSV